MILKILFCCCIPFVVGRLKHSPAKKFFVSEDQTIGSDIGTINSSFIDSKKVTFLPIMRPPVEQYFLVDQISGKIRLKRQLDREIICPDSPVECVLNFKVKVSDIIHDISVIITDVNDNHPKFSNDEYKLKISESSKIGSQLPLPIAIDKDSEPNGIVNYKIISDSVNKETERDFKIVLIKLSKGLTPFLRQINNLDRETIPKYRFNLRAEDKEGKYGETSINLDVDDANDNYPQWIGLPYQVTIRECDMLNKHLIGLAATDQDQGGYGTITYKIDPLAEVFVKNHFHLYGSSLFLSTNLDYENPIHRKIIVPVVATDEGGLTNSTNVEIRVDDCNDNSPVINIAYQSSQNGHTQYSSQYEKVSINENDDREINIVTIDVTDADSDDNSRVSCELETFKDAFRLQKLDEDNGQGQGLWLQLIKNQGYNFDREKMSTIKIEICCRDNGVPPRTTRHSVLISVNDVNDNEPKLISGFSFSITENNENGAMVGKFEGSDLDENENKGIEYNLIHESVPNTFHLTKDGLLYTNRKLDRETVSKYKLGISLTDKKEPRKSSFYNITVNVLDDNDGIPMYLGDRIFRIVESYDVSVSQLVIGQLNATDSDEGLNGVIEFLLDNSKIVPEAVKHFYTVSKNGLLTVRGNLDREKIPIHQIVVIIQDRGEKPQSTTVQLTIHLLDINDNKPVFSFPTIKDNFINITTDASPGNTIGMIKAEDKDLGDNGTVNFECRPKSNYFTIDKTGDIVLKQPLNQNNARTEFKHTINIRAYDLGNRSLQEFARLFIYITDTQAESSRKNGESWDNYPNNNDPKNRNDDSGNQNSSSHQKRKQMNIIILMIMVVLVMIIFFAVVAVLSFIYFKKDRFSLFGAASSHRNTEKAGTNYTGHKTNQPCEISRMPQYPNLTNNPINEYTTKEGIRVAQFNSETSHRNSTNFYNTLLLPESRACTFQNNNDEYQNRNSSINSSDLHQKIALLDYSNFFESEEYRDHGKEEYFPLNHNVGLSHPMNNTEFNKRTNISQNQQRTVDSEDYRVDFKTPQLQKKPIKINSSFV